MHISEYAQRHEYKCMHIINRGALFLDSNDIKEGHIKCQKSEHGIKII